MIFRTTSCLKYEKGNIGQLKAFLYKPLVVEIFKYDHIFLFLSLFVINCSLLIVVSTVIQLGTQFEIDGAWSLVY